MRQRRASGNSNCAGVSVPITSTKGPLKANLIKRLAKITIMLHAHFATFGTVIMACFGVRKHGD